MKNKHAFTLLEVLLVVAIIAILAGIVALAINPGRQLGETRNAERAAEVSDILNAVSQYSINNNGGYPSGITGTSTEICATGAASCTGLVDLSVLTSGGEYMSSIPMDPQGGDDPNGTGYYISRVGRLQVTAPNAELGATISITI